MKYLIVLLLLTTSCEKIQLELDMVLYKKSEYGRYANKPDMCFKVNRHLFNERLDKMVTVDCSKIKNLIIEEN